jgi:hypothetical protein
MDDNRAVAHACLAFFNADDLDALFGLYADDADHTPPKLRARNRASDVEDVRHVPNEAEHFVAEVFDVRAGKIVASRV